LQNVWARELCLSVEYLAPRQNAGLTVCSRSIVKKLKNEIAVNSLKCEQKQQILGLHVCCCAIERS